jgi:hypothetical protein
MVVTMADDDVLRDTDPLADARSHPSVALMVAGANGQARRIAPACLVRTRPTPRGPKLA